MSLLSVENKDLKGGQGKPLPPRTYRFIVESVTIEQKENGTMLALVLGNLRTKEGEGEFQYQGQSYRIGNRKVFARHWIDHTNPEAAKAGHGQIAKLAISTGLVATPNGAGKVELDYDSWETFSQEVTGREGIVVTKQSTWKGKDGELVTDADVSTYLAP